MFKSEDRAIVKKAAIEARSFIKEHKAEFWELYKPLAYLFVFLMFFDAYMSNWYPSRFSPKFTWGGNITAVLFAFFQIRLFYFFSNSSEYAGKFKYFLPKKLEWKVILVTAGVSSFFLAVFGGLGFVFFGRLHSYIGTEGVALILTVFVFLLFLYISIRLSFYIIARFSGHKLTLWQSISATDGFVLKIFLAYFLSAWKLIVVLFFLLFATGMLGIMVAKNGVSYQLSTLITSVFVDLPTFVYFLPLLSAHYIATVLFFYKNFMAEKGITEDDLLNG